MKLVKAENVSHETCTMVIIMNLVQRFPSGWYGKKIGDIIYTIFHYKHILLYMYFVSMAHTKRKFEIFVCRHANSHNKVDQVISVTIYVNDII